MSMKTATEGFPHQEHLSIVKQISYFKHPPLKEVEVWLLKSCFKQNFTLSFKQKCFPQTTNLCRGCQASPETISHIILECPVAARQREKLQKEIGDLTLRSVLGTAKSMRATESFISSSKLHEIFFNCI